LPPHRVDSFFFYVPVHHHHLHSFPTRRSSDLANVANIKRSSNLKKLSFILSFTTCSDIGKPGISLLVLSDSKHRTPSRPISAIFVNFAGSPTGVKSNLYSPRWPILQEGDVTMTPYESGILCVTRKKPTEVFRNLMTSSS